MASLVRPSTSTYRMTFLYSGGRNFVSASRFSYRWLSESKVVYGNSRWTTSMYSPLFISCSTGDGTPGSAEALPTSTPVSKSADGSLGGGRHALRGPLHGVHAVAQRGGRVQ